ncbi:hypothetical protein ARALYDRAFT_322516 [Arabidopsis lyrata subsp. lyrata]|uniref:Cleavage and polyadenylation specificity factor subunit 3-II n=1 Tax=Arabidopsis lyrata subsp. lyrata TaxID=81972 RepID=D7LLV0_ARALL|nr:hypothetical protein ARALYDRAFT_322516 [Arabidopsis lyrata subsp. lyrata]
MAIDCLVLGAGQEIGKSCVVVTINGKRIMFDCGMHMGCDDHNRYPDFSLVSKSGDFDNAISCIIITHFHMDHVGALPYFTEVCGYNGPIYMSYPTKALSPLMLEDYRRVMVDRRGEDELFTTAHIANCMKKVIAIDLKQTIQVDEDLQIRAYYAGHVLGAVMVYAKVGDAAIVYTGDYNMTTDRHLGAAKIDRLQLDLLISESTYATTIRGSKYPREREFLQAVHKCVAGGGKALIPSFALGRAQELCMLLDDYWERMNIKVPIYFSSGLTIQANMYYKMLISWTSQNVKEKHNTHNPFDFKNVKDFDRSLIHAPGPCVLFATPGMLCAGFSLEVFKHWAPSPLNLVALPGYSVAGTVGHKLMSGKPTTVDLYNGTKVDVRCKIHQVAFSPHTDAKGIMDLTKFLSPKNVVLVHGEKPSMMILKDKITSELDIPCFVPANGETVSVASTTYIKANASDMFLKSCSSPNFKFSNSTQLRVTDQRTADGVLVIEKSKKAKIVHQDEVSEVLHEKNHVVSLAYCCPVKVKGESDNDADLIKQLSEKILKTVSGAQIHESENFVKKKLMSSSDSTAARDQHAPLLRPRHDGSSSSSSSSSSARPTALAVLLGRITGHRAPSMLVRETAARALEERRIDWGYSKPVVAADILWNAALVLASAVMLVGTVEERPNEPIRVWICGYGLQCLIHVVLVWSEYWRRNTTRRARDLESGDHEDYSVYDYEQDSDNSTTYRLSVIFLAIDVFFAIFCVVLACLVGIALCCCLPCIIALLYAVAGTEGVSEAELGVLPLYKFKAFHSNEKNITGPGLLHMSELIRGWCRAS